MGKYAHFESNQVRDLRDLYVRHAEVARDVHQDVLRHLTGDKDLTVDLVPISILDADQKALDKMSEYDVVSFSTGSSVVTSGIVRADNAVRVKKYFEENSDAPILVSASGNNGRDEEIAAAARVADFSRTSLVVSEAQFDKDGAVIENLSNWRKVTMATDNPFNRGVEYQIIDMSPSLDGHEEHIRQWLTEKEEIRRQDAAVPQDGQSLEEARYYALFTHDERELYAQSDVVSAQVAHFMKNPQELHSLVIDDLKKEYNFDEKGYSSDINGTSFSAPEQAAYISKAHLDQEQREDKGLPILSKEEISTLARLATVDTDRGEEQKLLYSYNNSANFTFTAAGGHGVFHPQMFDALLDHAYENIERNPSIDRDLVNVQFTSDDAIKNNGQETVLSADLEDKQSIVIERMRVDFSMSGNNPGFAFYSTPDKDSVPTPVEHAGASMGYKSQSWSRIESNFGETLKDGDTLKFRAPNAHMTTVHDASITVYGYNEGSLMHQMMDYSKEIAPQFMPQPEENKVEAIPAVLKVDGDMPIDPSRSGGGTTFAF